MSNNLENYEEKYNQALKRAKEFMTNKGVSPNADAFKTAKELTETIFPELRESEDERIKKGLIKGLSTMRDIHKHQTFSDDAINIDDAIAWLEKQGEHANFRNKIQVGDKVTKNEDGVLVNISQLKRVAKPSEKSANKNKPKFKVGDWITNGEYTWKVIDIKPLDYLLQAQNGDVVDDTTSYVDEEFHLWTIQDAKAGDVLAYPDGTIVIFKYRLDGLNSGIYMSYILLVTKIEISQSCVVSKDITPATKEQRDKFEKAITESGYKWNKEDLKLEKI